MTTGTTRDHARVRSGYLPEGADGTVRREVSTQQEKVERTLLEKVVILLRRVRRPAAQGAHDRPGAALARPHA